GRSAASAPNNQSRPTRRHDKGVVPVRQEGLNRVCGLVILRHVRELMSGAIRDNCRKGRAGAVRHEFLGARTAGEERARRDSTKGLERARKGSLPLFSSMQMDLRC